MATKKKAKAPSKKENDGRKISANDENILYYDREMTGQVVYVPSFKKYFSAGKAEGWTSMKPPKGHECAVMVLGHVKKGKLASQKTCNVSMGSLGLLRLQDLERILPESSLKKIKKFYDEELSIVYTTPGEKNGKKR